MLIHSHEPGTRDRPVLGVVHGGGEIRTAETLEVFRLDGETYRLIGTYRGDAHVRAEPFDAIELELGALWRR